MSGRRSKSKRRQRRAARDRVISVTVDREVDGWIARALEINLVGRGSSPELALDALYEAIGVGLAAAADEGVDFWRCLRPSAKPHWDRYRRWLAVGDVSVVHVTGGAWDRRDA